MTRHLGYLLLLGTGLSLPLAPAAAQVTRTAVAAQQQARQVKIAFLIGAEQTRREVARSDAVIQALYKRLDTATAQTRASLRRANLSDQERRRLQGELGRLRDEQDTLISQLAAKDTEYAASIRAYREGIGGLLSDNDPRILALIERAADGDTRAVVELQDLTRIIRMARQAGLNARNAADQRGVATVWLNANDKGEVSARQALAAWQEAATIDPEQFSQWRIINYLADELGDKAIEIESANQLWVRAKSREERLAAVKACAGLHIADGRWCKGDWSHEQYQSEELRLRREQVALDLTEPNARLNLARTLFEIGSLLDDDKSRRDSLLAESLTLLKELSQRYPSNPSIEDLSRRVSLEAGFLKLDQGAERERTRQIAENAVAAARLHLKRAPNSYAATSALVRELGTLAYVADADRNEAQSVALTSEAVALAESAYAADPASHFRAASLWHALSRAARSARVYAAFQRERDYYVRALALGRPFVATQSEYMFQLTLPRLAQAELLLGDVEGARKHFAETLFWNPDARCDDLTTRATESALRVSNIDFIERKYVAAEQRLRDLLACVIRDSDETGQNQIFFETDISLELISMLIEQQRYDDAVAVGNAARARLKTAARKPDLKAEADLNAALIDFVLINIPGSGRRASDLKVPKLNGLDPDEYYVDESATTMLAALAAAKDEPYGSGTRREKVIASFRTMFRITKDFFERGPSSENRVAGLLSILKFRALVGDPDVTWQMVADNYLEAHRLRWLTKPGNIEAMIFAVARAALLSRRSNSDLSPK